MNTLLYLQNILAETPVVTAAGYTFSWFHILIGILAVFIFFKLIAFQITMVMKLIITILIIAAAVYFIYYT